MPSLLRGRLPKGRPGYYEPTERETVAAVATLYGDELKPFGRVLLKRVRELEAARRGLESLDEAPLVDPARLRDVCTGCASLCVCSEEGREFSVTLRSRLPTFVDASDPADRYPEELWGALSLYLAQAPEAESRLPGGRYACAKVLAGRGLPCLQGRSLGEVCHIVQLAISSRRILGHLEGHTVPYAFSEEWMKIQCARSHQPERSPKRAASAMPVASWDQALAGLAEILEQASGPGPGAITLSNVKRLFNSRFRLQLSETALGYSRLIDLLRDVRFCSVCRVSSQEGGQIVVKKATCWDQAALGNAGQLEMMQDPGPMLSPYGYLGQCHFDFGATALTPCAEAPPCFGAWDLCALPASPICTPPPYEPMPYAWAPTDTAGQLCAASYTDSTSDGSEVSSKFEVDDVESCAPPPSKTVLFVEGRVKNTFLHFGCAGPAQTAGGAKQRSKSVPRAMGSSKTAASESEDDDDCPAVFLALQAREPQEGLPAACTVPLAPRCSGLMPPQPQWQQVACCC